MSCYVPFIVRFSPDTVNKKSIGFSVRKSGEIIIMLEDESFTYSDHVSKVSVVKMHDWLDAATRFFPIMQNSVKSTTSNELSFCTYGNNIRMSLISQPNSPPFATMLEFRYSNHHCQFEFIFNLTNFNSITSLRDSMKILMEKCTKARLNG
jgi:hypothetical protein